MSKYSLDQFTYKLKTNSWDRVPRDPVTLFVGHTLFGAGVLTATQMFIAKAIVYIGASLVTSYLLNALMPKAPDGSRELTTSVRDAAAPREIVYGEVRKGGVITHLESTDDNRYLHMFVALAGHEIESVEGIYINDEDQTANWSRSSGLINGGSGTNWNNKVRVFAHLGAQTSATDTFEDSTKTLANTYHTETELSDINSNFIGKGVAYLYIRHDYDKDVYADGIPEVSVVVRGKKVQNTSGVAQTYPNSANAALVIRDYLINEYGVGDDSTNIDATSFATAQTVCNTSSGSGDANKFEVNGVLSTGNSRIDNLETLTAACGGALFWGSGEWKLKAAAFTSSVKTLTMADLRGNVQIDTKHSVRDNFNAVQGTFFDKDQDWVEVDYPEIAPSEYLTEDNNEKNVLDLPFQVVTNSAQAQRLAKLTLNRHREQITFIANFGLEAFDLEVGDVIKFNDYNAEDGTYRYGFYSATPANQKTFEVIGWKFAPIDEDNDLQITLTLRETSSTAFDWDAEEETIVGNNTNLPKPFVGVAVSNLTVSDGGGEVQGDGSVVNSLVASWNAPDSAFINYYEIRWGQTSSANRTTFTTTDTSIVLSPVVDGVEYTVEVRAVTSNGFRGAFVSNTATAGGDTTAPNAPTSLSATGGYKYITLSWTNPADADLNYVEIYENTSATTVGATVVGTSAGNRFVRTNLGLDETKYYYLKAVDFSGNKSGFSSGTFATTEYIDNADFENGVRQLFIDQNLDIIAPVSSLPASGDFTGQQVFLTSDGKLYQWSGSAWVLTLAAADGGDITDATITGNKVVANTITGGLLATSGIITASAQIDNAIIENANIKNAAVDTLKIAGDSVTISSYVGFSLQTGAPYTFSTNVSMAYAGDIMLIGNIIMFGTGTGSSVAEFRAKIAGTTYDAIGIVGTDVIGTHTLLGGASVSAGTTTLQLTVTNVSNISSSQAKASMAILRRFR